VASGALSGSSFDQAAQELYPEDSMSRLCSLGGLAGVLAAALVACSDSTSPPATVALTAVSPTPSATAVATSTTIMLTFDHPMASGMEQYMDLHQGGVDGPTVPMNCAWNPDHTTVTCTPAGPLAHGTPHTIHVGAGMTDQHGDLLDMDHWTTMGGQWCTDSMMGGTHDGHHVGTMDDGWRHGGHYGMAFAFTTA
jgi:hypothetical protein